jgi:hypothetical protein
MVLLKTLGGLCVNLGVLGGKQCKKDKINHGEHKEGRENIKNGIVENPWWPLGKPWCAWW